MFLGKKQTIPGLCYTMVLRTYSLNTGRTITGFRHSLCISTVLVRVMFTVIKQNDQNKLESKGFIQFILPCHSSASKEISTGLRQGRNLQVGDDAEVMDELCLMACSSSQLAFIQGPGRPAQGWPHHTALGPPPSITNLRTCPTDRSYGTFSPLDMPPLR